MHEALTSTVAKSYLKSFSLKQNKKKQNKNQKQKKKSVIFVVKKDSYETNKQ